MVNKIALVGLGYIGKIHLKILNDNPKWDLVGVYDIDTKLQTLTNFARLPLSCNNIILQCHYSIKLLFCCDTKQLHRQTVYATLPLSFNISILASNHTVLLSNSLTISLSYCPTTQLSYPSVIQSNYLTVSSFNYTVISYNFNFNIFFGFP